MKRFLIPFLLLACVLPLGLGWVHSADDDKVLTAGEIRTILDDVKIKYDEEKDDEDKTFFVLKLEEDTKVLLYQYGGGEKDQCSSLQLVFAVEGDDSIKVDKMNSWNRDERYTKAYLDDEKNIFLEQDMDLSAGFDKAAVRKFVKDFVKILPEFAEHLTSKD